MSRNSDAIRRRLVTASRGPPELVLLPLAPQGEWLSIRGSHDVTGFNDDGFTGTYSYQYKTEQGWVLFDHKGPGCIMLLRTIGFKGRLVIYEDRGPEEGEPRWKVAFQDVYSGRGDWPAHLVANMEKGHGSEWCYRPIPFMTRCVIVAQEEEGPPPGPHFYSIWAHLYRSGEESDASIRGRLPRIASGWSDPLPRKPETRAARGRREAGRGIPGPGGRLTVFEHEGAGLITSLVLEPVGGSSQGFGEAALKQLFLRARWDTAEDESGGWESGPKPDVDAPIGLFFARGYSAAAQSGSYTVHHGETGDVSVPLGAAAPRSIAVGETADGRLYSDYESVAFLYHRLEQALFLTDHIDTGSRESRESHAYRAGGVERVERRALVYEGNAQVQIAAARDRSSEDILLPWRPWSGTWRP